MTFNDSSSIILIVGAIAILACVVHGLWFSGRSINRKLVKNSKEDQEIARSCEVGKVRIIIPTTDENKESLLYAQKHKVETFVNAPNKNEEQKVFGEKEDDAVSSSYELNLYAQGGKAYRGLDLEELFSTYGFIRGDKDIFCVYEQPDLKDRIVFRVCSLEAPYYFPQDMSKFETSSLAFYMQLPPKGKGFVYFKAMCIAARCITEHLGGTIYDNDKNEITQKILDSIEHSLRMYDKSED